MIWVIIGTAVGYIWGVFPACIGFLVGMMVNTLVRGQANTANPQNDESESQDIDDIPMLTEMIGEFGANASSFIDEDYSGSCSMNDGMDVNPANGLPMVGCLDVVGNAFGTSHNDFFEDTNCFVGCDDPFIDNFMNDCSGCGPDDW